MGYGVKVDGLELFGRGRLLKPEKRRNFIRSFIITRFSHDKITTIFLKLDFAFLAIAFFLNSFFFLFLIFSSFSFFLFFVWSWLFLCFASLVLFSDSFLFFFLVVRVSFARLSFLTISFGPEWICLFRDSRDFLGPHSNVNSPKFISLEKSKAKAIKKDKNGKKEKVQLGRN